MKKIYLIACFVLLITSFLSVNAEDLTITDVKTSNITNSSATISFFTNGNYKCTLIHSTKDGILDNDELVETRDRNDLIFAYIIPSYNSGGNFYYSYVYNIDGFAKNYTPDIYDISKGIFYFKLICDSAFGGRVISSVNSFQTDTSKIDLYPGYIPKTDKLTYNFDEIIKLNITAVNKNITKYFLDIYGEKTLTVGRSDIFKIKSNVEINNGETIVEIPISQIIGFISGGSGKYLISVCSINGCTNLTTNSANLINVIDSINKPDLIISSFDIKETNTKVLLRNPYVGEEFYIQPLYNNIGTSNAIGPFSIDLYVDNIYKETKIVTKDCIYGQGETTEFLYTLILNTSGQHTIKFVVDS